MCVQQDILAALAYFDLFDYPITQTEIFQFLSNPYPHETVVQGLQQLSAESWVYKMDEFYSLQDNYALVVRRRQGNQRARRLLQTAEKIAGFLSSFPFVRGVAVSGSLSKNFADEGSDIDFFIITAGNRLWIARTLMHLFKKITFLFNRQDWFCMNYYIDETELCIRENNRYTATEVATLLPLRGITGFHQFYANNKWSRSFLPSHLMRISYVKEMRNTWLKNLTEFLLDNPLAGLMDNLLMRLTARRWNKKTRLQKRNSRGILMGMDAGRHHAKPDPSNFQKTLLRAYDKKTANLFRAYQNKAKTIY